MQQFDAAENSAVPLHVVHIIKSDWKEQQRLFLFVMPANSDKLSSVTSPCKDCLLFSTNICIGVLCIVHPYSLSKENKPPAPNYIMPWNPLPGLVLSSKVGRFLCTAAKLGHRVSWIPLIPTKDKHPTVSGLLLCVWQTNVASHTQFEQPCLKLSKWDVVCVVPCHLGDSYREALTYWRQTEQWLHPLGLSESCTLHTHAPTFAEVIGWSQMSFSVTFWQAGKFSDRMTFVFKGWDHRF